MRIRHLLTFTLISLGAVMPATANDVNLELPQNPHVESGITTGSTIVNKPQKANNQPGKVVDTSPVVQRRHLRTNYDSGYRSPTDRTRKDVDQGTRF